MNVARGGRGLGTGGVVVTAALSLFLLGLSAAGFYAVQVAERDRLTSAALRAAMALHEQVMNARPRGPEALQEVLAAFEAESVVSVAVIGPMRRVVASSEAGERGRVVESDLLEAAFATGESQAGSTGDAFEAYIPVRHLRGMRHRFRHGPPPFGDPDHPPDPWGPGLGNVVVRMGMDTAGSWLWNWAAAQAAASAAVVVALWVGLARSRRTAALLARAEADRRRREVLARLGEVSAVLAHEIRNPIAAAKGQVQLAAEAARGGASAEHIARRLETAVQEVGRVEALVRGLLDYARDRPLSRGPVAAPDVVEVALAHAGLKPGAIEVDGGAGVLLDADPRELGRALGNVVQNAVEAAGPSGQVRLTIRRDGGDVVLTVHDSGPGVPGDLVDRVFDPFVTGKLHGVGLGLAVARQVVEAHGGRIAVGRSEALGGAAFDIRVPAARGGG